MTKKPTTEEEFYKLKQVNAQLLDLKTELMAQVYELRSALHRAEDREAQQVAEKNAVYRERNQLVAFLTRVYPSGIRPTEIEGWDPEWHNCVYIETPAQLSWHYHDGDAPLFAHLPPYWGEWDGHTTDQKYERLALLRPRQGVK